MSHISEVQRFLDKEFTELDVGIRRSPILFGAGIVDSAVHAAGVSYLLSLGLECELPAIAEYPITVHSTDPWKRLGRIWPDSTWFHPQTHKPVVVFEFERFEKGDENKIREKVENLALSYHQSRANVELCVFIYWLRSSSAPMTVNHLFETFSNGFSRKGIRVPPPSCKLLVYKMVMRQIERRSRARDIVFKEERATYLPDGVEREELLVVQEIRQISL